MKRVITACVACITATAAPLAAQQPAAVDSLELRSAGLVADVFVPTGAGPHPALLLLGGSGGGLGWQRYMGGLLAQRGYVAMALGYFGVDGVAAELERIPLEYVEHAVTWLRHRPYVDSLRVGVGGVSKGGELALLIASLTPAITAIAVFVPSGYVFQSIAEGFPATSSWSYRGRDVPFVRYGRVEAPRNLGELYRAGVEQSDSLDAATIRVERINGPILLLSGRDDTLWPSAWLAGRVTERLQQHGFAHPHEHIVYDDAGHLISSIREDDVSYRGGSPDGNRRAQIDAQRRFLEFFDRYLMLLSPIGFDLAVGTELVYASGGASQEPWAYDSVRVVPNHAFERCVLVARRGQPARESCVRGDTLFERQPAGDYRATRPIGTGMRLEVRTATGNVLEYVTGATSSVRIGARSYDVVHTTITTRDADGRVVRRLRETYAPSLLTATAGSFEEPDGAGGWQIARAFELVEVRD